MTFLAQDGKACLPTAPMSGPGRGKQEEDGGPKRRHSTGTNLHMQQSTGSPPNVNVVPGGTTRHHNKVLRTQVPPFSLASYH